MQLLSSKFPRLPGQWENSFRKTVWRTIQRATSSFWSNGWISSDFNQDLVNLVRKLYQEYFLRMHWSREEFGKETLWFVFLEELDKVDASEFILWESMRKKHWYHRGRRIHIPSSRWSSKIARKRPRIPRTHSMTGTNRKAKISVENFKANWESLHRQNQKMTLKPVPTSCRFKVNSSIDNTMNFEFNSTCRRKKHFLFRWNTLVLQGPLMLIWTSCKKRLLMTTGMSIRTEVCQILGEDSQNSFYWKKTLPRDICGPGGDWQKFKRLRDQIMYGLEYVAKLGKPIRVKKKEGQNEKPKLDNARRLRGIYFFWSGWRRIQGNLFNCEAKNLERPTAAAMPCKKEIHSNYQKTGCGA